MMELIERRDVASQKMGVRLFFSQNDLVILILVPVRRNGQPLVQMGKRELGGNFFRRKSLKAQRKVSICTDSYTCRIAKLKLPAINLTLTLTPPIWKKQFFLFLTLHVEDVPPHLKFTTYAAYAANNFSVMVGGAPSHSHFL